MKLLMAALALSAAAIAGVNPETPHRGGQLVIAVQGEPKTDLLKTSDEPSAVIRYLTGGVLIRRNRQTQEPEPALALSWKASEGGRSMTLRLREGVNFSDGSPFRAKDVCFTFQRLMDPAFDSPFASSFEAAKGKTTCKAEGQYAVTLRFPIAIVAAERLFDEIPMLSSTAANLERAALGPFAIAEHHPGSHLILSRNPNFWKKDEHGGSLPYLDSIRVDIQRNRDLELLRFRKGEIHMVNKLDPDSFDRLKPEMPGAVRDIGVALDAEQLWFNLATNSPLAPHLKAWFASREFRYAISAAIRRDDLIRVVYRGHATPAFAPISPANRQWWNPALTPPKDGLPLALELLRSQGFRLDGETLRDKTGRAVEFSIVTNAGNKSRERVAAMIQQDLKRIGIRVSVVMLDFPSLVERITKTFQYETCLLGVIHTDLDPSSDAEVWTSAGSLHEWNPGQKTPATPWETEIDRLMTVLATVPEHPKRKAAFDQVQKIVVEQAPAIFLAFRNTLGAGSAKLGNYEPVPVWPEGLWNAERIYFKQ
jgi:peptide/nickel transport system substrate-binding protein